MYAMKKLLSLIVAVSLTAGLFAQIQVQVGTTQNLSTSVANGVGVSAAGYVWTVPAAVGAISGTTGTNDTVTFVAAAVPGSATVSVYATSTTGTCAGPSQTLVVDVVTTLSLNAALTNIIDVCPLTTNETGDFAVTINFTDAVGVATAATSVTYSIDGGASVTEAVAGTSVTFTAAGIATPGAHRINVLSATNGTVTVNYAVGTGVGSVYDAFNVLTAPVLNAIN
jgi:hypothetical protein